MERREEVTLATRVIVEDKFVRIVGIGASHTEESVASTFAAVRELTGGRRMPLLFDTRNWGNIEPTSWAHFIRHIEDACTAAVVIGVPGRDDFYVGAYPAIIDSLVVPFRVFDNEEEAMQFLASLPAEGGADE